MTTGKLNGWVPHIVQLVTTILGLWLLMDKVPSKAQLFAIQAELYTLTSKVSTIEANQKANDRLLHR